MYILIVFLPLIGSLIVGTLHLFKIPLKYQWIGLFTGGFVFTSFLISLKALFEVGINKDVHVITLKPWITTEIYDLHWSFLFDSLTCVMLLKRKDQYIYSLQNIWQMILIFKNLCVIYLYLLFLC